MTSTNVPAITSDTAVANVYDTLTSAFNMWGDAYTATRNDVLAGHTVKAISAAWKELQNPGIPTSVAMVGSFAAAASLTDTGLYADAWLLAFKGKVDDDGTLTSTYHGEIEPAHRIIERARKASGMDAIGTVLQALNVTIAEHTDTEEETGERDDDMYLGYVLAAVSAIKDLSTKRKDESDDESDDESGEGSDDDSEESTPDDRAASVIAVLTALIDGGVPASDPMNMEMARLAKAYFSMCAPVKAAKTA